MAFRFSGSLGNIPRNPIPLFASTAFTTTNVGDLVAIVGDKVFSYNTPSTARDADRLAIIHSVDSSGIDANSTAPLWVTPIFQGDMLDVDFSTGTYGSTVIPATSDRGKYIYPSTYDSSGAGLCAPYLSIATLSTVTSTNVAQFRVTKVYSTDRRNIGVMYEGPAYTS